MCNCVREAELAEDFCLKSFNASFCCRANVVLTRAANLRVLAQKLSGHPTCCSSGISHAELTYTLRAILGA